MHKLLTRSGKKPQHLGKYLNS